MTEATANILVVDDDDGGRYLKAHVLRKHGYHVTEACDRHGGDRAVLRRARRTWSCSTSCCPTSTASR